MPTQPPTSSSSANAPSDLNAVIDMLVDDARPVQVVRLGRIYALWAATCLVAGSIFLANVGTRPDLAERMHDVRYVGALLCWLGALAATSRGFVSASVPGAWRTSGKRLTIITSLFYAGALGLYALAAGDPVATSTSPAAPESLDAFACCLRIAMGTTMPTLVAIFFMARLAPFDVKRPLALAMMASGTVVSIVSQLNCPIDDVSHVLIGHGLMLATVGLAGFVIFHVVARRAHRVQVQRTHGADVAAAYFKAS